MDCGCLKWNHHISNKDMNGYSLYLQENMSNNGIHIKQGVSREFSE